MRESFRQFDAGPDPFGRRWNVKFRWLQTAISIRHADAIDVKFFLSCEDGSTEEKVISLPYPALLAAAGKAGRQVTDSWCSRIAAAHLSHMIATFEDMDKTLVTMSVADIQNAVTLQSSEPVLAR